MDIALVTLTLAATVSLIRDPIFGSEAGLTFSRELLRGSQFGGTEGAAFVVDRGDGELACLVWPHTHQYHQETFNGAMPPGTVAIIHTHPMRVPMPSPQDIRESRRVGIPIYVLTPTRVTKAVPTSASPVTVHRGTWLIRSNGGPHCQLLRNPQ